MTELQRKAAEAWAGVIRSDTVITRLFGAVPMPVWAALDYCQDVTGDRGDAVTALIGAGADWLDAQAVPGGSTGIDSSCMRDRELIASHLRLEVPGMALVHLGHILEQCRWAEAPLATGAERWAANSWRLWADTAALVVATCRAVIEAAYPAEAPTE